MCALREVAELVRRESGIALRDAQLPALQAALEKVDRTLDAERLLATRGDPIRRAVLIRRVIGEVTFEEPSFLRRAEELERLDWPALAAAAAARGEPEVRVWCVACGSGEEAYSLALLAAQAFEPAVAPSELVRAAIIATDIAPSSLRRARDGHYPAAAARGVPAELRARWLPPARDGGVEVAGSIRTMVRFVEHNLVRDPIPPPGERPFDAIVCRSILDSFEPETARQTIAALRGALAPGGVLVLGEPPARERDKPLARLRPGPDIHVRHPPAALPAGGLPVDPGAPDGSPRAVLAGGLGLLERGDLTGAAGELRRALALDPSLAMAAFQLGRVHEALDDSPAARRAYRRALLALGDRGGEGADVALACRARLLALGERCAGS